MADPPGAGRRERKSECSHLIVNVPLIALAKQGGEIGEIADAHLHQIVLDRAVCETERRPGIASAEFARGDPYRDGQDARQPDSDRSTPNEPGRKQNEQEEESESSRRQVGWPGNHAMENQGHRDRQDGEGRRGKEQGCYEVDSSPESNSRESRTASEQRINQPAPRALAPGPGATGKSSSINPAATATASIHFVPAGEFTSHCQVTNSTPTRNPMAIRASAPTALRTAAKESGPARREASGL